MKTSFTVLFLCVQLKLGAQTFYSVDPDYLKYKLEGNNLFTSYRSVYPDTTMENFHNFFPRNFLGNIGLSSPDYFLKYGTDQLGFRFFQPPITSDKICTENIAYFNTKGPYADLTGITGAKQLQAFKLNFTHTFHERLNFALKFNRYSSAGYYRKQQSFTNNLLFNSNYNTKSERFGYYAYFLNNTNKNKENGGIKDSVLNDSTVLLNKGIMAVNLDSAFRENRESKLMFNPWFRLNPKKDSTPVVKHILQLKSIYASNKYRYKDQSIGTDNYYNTFYYDTVRTNDSSHVKKFSNEVDYSVMSRNNLAVSAGYRHEYNEVWQRKDSVFSNQMFTSALLFKKEINTGDSLIPDIKEWQSTVDYHYVLIGPNKGNYKLENKNNLYLNTEGSKELYCNVLFESRNADYIYNNWNSNQFIWSNRYKPQVQLQSLLGARLGKHFSATVLYQSISNYLYFDAQALPRQYSGTINNLAVQFNYHTILFKHLGLSLNYAFQNTSHTEFVRLPQNAGTAKLYYYANLFNKNMQLHLGGQLQVYQSFTAYGFMPATQVVVIQDQFKTDNYPYLDIYLNVRIRPATFFVKFENVLAGYAGSNFALVPGYYQPQLAFRCGLSWLFFD